MAEYGFRFQPGADQALNGQTIGAGIGPGGGGSPQQAVKILSLRVPPALPANAPVSRALLTAPGSAAPGGSALNSLVQQLLQAFRPSARVPQMPMPQGPMAPQTMPTAPPSGAMPGGGSAFVGNIDTPPLQNAPPLFDGTGGFDASTYQAPPWEQLGITQDQWNLGPSYWLPGASAGSQVGAPNAPAQRPGGNYPRPGLTVENPPLGGGQRA